MPLTSRAVSIAKAKDKDYKLGDSKGLYLLVKKTGAKYWRLKYRHLDKEKKSSHWAYTQKSPSKKLATAAMKPVNY